MRTTKTVKQYSPVLEQKSPNMMANIEIETSKNQDMRAVISTQTRLTKMDIDYEPDVPEQLPPLDLATVRNMTEVEFKPPMQLTSPGQM